MIPRADAEDVNRAVEAAHKASRGPWRSMTATQRGAVMRKLADALVGEADRLAEIEVRDNGKLYAEMVSQTRYLPEWLYYFAGLADKVEGAVLPDRQARQPHVHAA